MKKTICGIFLLILIHVSLFQTNGLLYLNDNQVPNINMDMDQSHSVYDVDREIVPVQEPTSNLLSSNFRPSPLILNNGAESNNPSSKIAEDSLTINIDLEKQVLTVGETLQYIIQVTQGFEPVAGQNFILDIIEGEYWGWYFYWLEDYSSYEERIIETKYITTDSNGIYLDQFTPPSSGKYSIVIREYSNHIVESRSFTVANIGLFWRVSREYIEGEVHQSIAYVLNTKDFSPVANVVTNLTGVTYYYDSEEGKYNIQTIELFSGVSNEEGIVEIEFIPSVSISTNNHFIANVSAMYNGETVYVSRSLYQGGYYWDWSGYSEYEPYEFIITTDKPIYTPGETVKTRVLIFENSYLKVTREPIQTSFTLKFLSPSHYTLLERKITSNEYGIATYAFPLDIDSELGKYLIVTQKDETLITQEIRVDKYEKPAFRVNIGLDREYVAPEGWITGNITAEYYFGKPVTQGEITLSIASLTVLSGVTDNDGVWKFEYKLPSESSLEGYSSIPLNVTVIDMVGRKVIDATSVQISNEVYVWSYINPWFPKVGENITIYFGAYQYSGWGRYWSNSWSSLSRANVEIKLYALTGALGSFYIGTLNGETDSNGQGKITYTLRSDIVRFFTRFKGIVKVDSGDGRKGTSKFYFTVDRNKVEITFDKDNYQAGDTVTLNILVYNAITGTNIDGNILIRVFDTDYDVVGYKNIQIPYSGTLLKIRLSNFAPAGNYYVHVYLETTYDSEWGSWTYYRYSNTVEFSVGSSNKLSISPTESTYSLTDSLTIVGHLEGSTNAPLMIQFVKKGIVATKYITATEIVDFIVTIDDIQFLAPRVWIFAFAVLDNGNIVESYLDLEIDSSLFVDISSNKKTYEPGESATIHIELFDAKNRPISTIMVVSFIDSSVFGVQPDLEAELTHFEEQSYWPSVWTGVSWKNRQNNWWFWWYDDLFIGGGWRGYGDIFSLEWSRSRDDVSFSSPENQQGITDELKGTQKEKEIRDNLPENAFWNPQVIVENGQVDIDLTLPDTIGEWTVRVVTTTSSGKGSLTKYSFNTFLPFFVEIEKEPFVLQDDIFVLKGVVYNYLSELTDITIEIETESGILVLGDAVQKLRLPSGFLGSIGWSCLALDVGFFNITIYSSTTLKNGTVFEDAIRKPLEIIPNGINSFFLSSGFISSDPSLTYTRYSEAVQQNVFMELSLGLGSVALNSWEKLIRYPYGCTEQTISRLIPNALVFQYLNTTGELTNETEALINDMILSGLSRIYSFHHNDGGWGWWYEDESRVYMTSLVLYGLGVIDQAGLYVDSTTVKSALNLLIQKQNVDGSWTPDSWRNIDQASFTAFVLRSIVHWSDLLDSSPSIANAINYIRVSWNDDSARSTYLAGLYLDSISGTTFGPPTFNQLLVNYLIDEAKPSSNGYYWSYATDDHHWWRALGGDIEVTALALTALINNMPGVSMHVIRGAVQWLLNQQSKYGWGNTADTAAAISSIITLSQSGVSSNEDTNVTLSINSQIIGTYLLTTSDKSSVYIDLDEYLEIGENQIELQKIGAGNVSYYFQGTQVLRSLPSIDLPTRIDILSEQQFQVVLNIEPSSLVVFATDITVKPLEGEITPISMEPRLISFLKEKESLSFGYLAPSEVGLYEIQGFEITYRLCDDSGQNYSPGIITRIYGPIQLSIIESIGQTKLSINQMTPTSHSDYKKLSSNLVTDEEDLTLDRSYSETKNLSKGDIVYVTLIITNNDEIENFVMVEDIIPAGFTIEESTITHSGGSYTLTSNGVTFFFPELGLGTTTIKYGIIANNIRRSLVAPAKLTSMYEDWDIRSTSASLGDSIINIDLATGNVITDLEAPILHDFVIEEVVSDHRTGLSIKVKVTDNWKIESVRIFIKQGSWNVYECSNVKSNWISFITDVREGNSKIYLEIIDTAGNVLITDPIDRYLKLQDLVIPFIPIMILIAIAFITAISSSVYIKKKIT